MPSTETLSDIRGAIENADRQFHVIEGGKRGGSGGPPEAQYDDAHCPVRPLGHLDGKFYFLDAVGQVRVLAARALGSRDDLMSLFMDEGAWLRGRFPLRKMVDVTGADGQPAKEERVVDFRKNAVSAWLISTCRNEGLFGDHLMIRRPGVWPEKNGMPIVHCGDVVFLGDHYEPAGTRTGNQIWAAAPPSPRPGEPADASIGTKFLEKIKAFWNFRKAGGEIAVLGLLGCAYYGAAIPWRPAGFFIGPAGSGKSSLLRVFAAACPVHFYTNDTSKAGLEQSLDGRAMPSFIDEAGDREDQRGARALLDLVLSAASGDGTKGSRGGQDGKARKIEVAGSIIMASISPPDMQAQHKGRFTIVDLKAANEGEDFSAEHNELKEWAREHGPLMWGRAIAGWERYRAALKVFRTALLETKCQPREMDQLGALMAGWWILTRDGIPNERDGLVGVGALTEFVRDTDEVAAESASMQVTNHLMSQLIQVQRSTERKSVAALIERVLTKDQNEVGEDVLVRNVAMEVLGQYGIRVIRASDTVDIRGREIPREATGAGVWFSPANAQLRGLFTGTPFEGQKWEYEIRRLESARCPKRNVRVGAMKPARCIWVSGEELGFGDIESV
ncbi:hypothetical protein [Kozakia baliensis]|uniref:Uncharacterized protein n=1 Tax=Kozakia baliensis TaxID=153496 RepID=A0A1D8UTJ4_9PROT|nr:hypothetical protein [Kozakia baliensis]AOX16936.1 hypothetical protein A0U89_07060 [Kozakia baliensis]GBR25537.1 hypothetical protein AA0488_0674 [Kozakia baliensis NRIC 0488]GEL64017.1 hypothetical protein KBA01_13030 [Kozakia baliensis]